MATHTLRCNRGHCSSRLVVLSEKRVVVVADTPTVVFLELEPKGRSNRHKLGTMTRHTPLARHATRGGFPRSMYAHVIRVSGQRVQWIRVAAFTRVSTGVQPVSMAGTASVLIGSDRKQVTAVAADAARAVGLDSALKVEVTNIGVMPRTEVCARVAGAQTGHRRGGSFSVTGGAARGRVT